jgi:hypothetical protein
MFDIVNQKSYLMFISQCNHHFVPALSFDGHGNFSITVTDRQGQAHINIMSILAAGKESALLILKILACLMYGTEGNVGLDTTMIHGLGSSISAIMVDRQKFYVDRMIY